MITSNNPITRVVSVILCATCVRKCSFNCLFFFLINQKINESKTISTTNSLPGESIFKIAPIKITNISPVYRWILVIINIFFTSFTSNYILKKYYVKAFILNNLLFFIYNCFICDYYHFLIKYKM